MLERLFALKQNKSSVKQEVLAGLTTFMTMAYIIIVNPSIMSATGMPLPALMTSTILVSALGSFLMAFIANMPFALAPGMGLNAFFAFTIVIGMGKSWQFALTAVFLEGIIFVLLSLFRVREAIIQSLPMTIRKAISVGIGLFIAFIGLINAGIVTVGTADSVPLYLGDIVHSPQTQLALIGLILTAALWSLRIKGALLLGIIITTLIGIPMGVTKVTSGAIVSMPASIAPIFLQFEWEKIFTIEMLVILFTMLFVDIFDTAGTLVGVAMKGGFIDKDGNVKKAKEAFLADAISTTTGAMLGSSPVTTFVESSAGVMAGGRTGLTALTVSGLFLASLFLSPLFLMVPMAATSPALILVGLMMLTPILEIDLHDFTEALPAFLVMLMMPLSYSISDGLAFGIISFVVIKLLTGRISHLKLTTVLLAILFITRYIFL
ncbi:NCS2 family permease [Entomospira entomophila]|uniref:NCS2 family permease n=1 Tax=Entomospira entomophila TaxID=2719988 RepID=A0A968KT18_9SPIO|nr:NCS2 family permease [Entomospira entomophilus]NIZ40967.1 NCS2 family permease [Entomospira entomophilus]WDI35180.1 NCS2 family permease [Entomospira entomophilus]